MTEENYFYCKYGGIIPICSDCKRNPIISNVEKEEIETWLVPRKFGKRCEDYLKIEENYDMASFR